MKYKDLKNGEWYTTKSMPGRKLKKFPQRKATCCSPACNTESKGGKKYMMDVDEEGSATTKWGDSLDLDKWLKDYSLDEIWRMGRMGGRS